MAVSAISAVRQAARNPEHLIMLESWTDKFLLPTINKPSTLHGELDKVFKVKNSTRRGNLIEDCKIESSLF